VQLGVGSGAGTATLPVCWEGSGLKKNQTGPWESGRGPHQLLAWLQGEQLAERQQVEACRGHKANWRRYGPGKPVQGRPSAVPEAPPIARGGPRPAVSSHRPLGLQQRPRGRQQPFCWAAAVADRPAPSDRLQARCRRESNQDQQPGGPIKALSRAPSTLQVGPSC